MKKFSALFLSLTAASLVSPVCLTLFMPISGDRDMVALIANFVVAFPYSFLAMLVLGIPLFLIGICLDLVIWWSGLVTGTFVEIVAAVLLPYPGVIDLSGLLFLVSVGALAGLIAWAVWHISMIRSSLAKR
ncbi:hypothetical protein [Rhizobium rhizogenes]|uniref:hypothetical protein n=1 Tax=Rhizobium rhizogenes TaxID=359 RepID=UPI002271969D|nr:hypothetical protein [Rhizobium rhizogenes]